MMKFYHKTFKVSVASPYSETPSNQLAAGCYYNTVVLFITYIIYNLEIITLEVR